MVRQAVIFASGDDEDWKYEDAEEWDANGDGILVLPNSSEREGGTSISGFPLDSKETSLDSPPSHFGIFSVRACSSNESKETERKLARGNGRSKPMGRVPSEGSTGTPGLKQGGHNPIVMKGKIGSEHAGSFDGEPTGHGDKENQEHHKLSTSKSPEVSDTKAVDSSLEILLSLDETTSVVESREAMRLLRSKVSSENHKEGEFALRRALSKVYSVMEKQRSNSSIQERAIYILGKLAREDVWVPTIVAETGGAERIVRVMGEHHTSKGVQERSVATLMHLTATSKARSAIVSAKGAESICWAMKGFNSIKAIQMQGGTALCNLAFASAENKKRLGKIGGIDVIVRAMDAHAADSEMQARCCLALRNLTCENRVNQWIAGRACAMEAILRAMESFQDDLHTQYQGCVALANLTRDEPENRSRAADISVLEATVKALQSYTSHGGLTEHGLILLLNLVRGSSDFQTNLGKLGGVQTTVKCLRQNITNPKVLAAGCNVLRHLLFLRENRLLLYDTGGLEVLVRALREGISSKDVLEAAIYALGNSAYDHPESKRALCLYGGMSALVDAMSQHMDNAGIQEHGCRALRNLADSDDLSGRLLAESGAIDSCIFACSGYPENARIQEHACAMLFNMAYSDSNIRRMKGLDVDRVTDQAKENHEDDKAVLSQATALQERLKALTTRIEPARGMSARGNKSFYLGSLASKGSGLLPTNVSRRKNFSMNAGD